jgi:putative ABC transport system permease protein
MIKNYFKTAWRNIKKRPGFSLINAGGLTLGIASCLLLLLYVAYHIGYDRQFSNINNIYIVENNQPGDGKIYTFAATPGPLADKVKTEIPDAVDAVRTLNYLAGGLVSYNNKSFEKAGLFADPGFFNMFSYHFIEGNPAGALAQPNSIVITKDLAKTLFGDDDAMGKMVMRNNKLPLTVSGVIDNVPANSSYQFDFVIPFTIFQSEQSWAKNPDWGTNYAVTFVQLKNASSFNRANNILGSVLAKYDKGSTEKLFLFPYSKYHLYNNFENGKPAGGLIDQIHLFEILAFCILLIACVNFMNLSTARSEERAKEVGIRKAIGSGKNTLIIQFITESLMLTFISTALALGILVACLPFFNNLLQIKMQLPVGNVYAWLLLFALALVTGFIAGSYPAFYLSSFKPVKVLKGVFRAGTAALSVRKVLVVVQFAFAVFLITATICIYRQIRYVQNRPMGYDKNNLVEIPVEGTLNTKSGVLIDELKSSGAITNGTAISMNILNNGNNTWGISWPGKRTDQKILIDVFNIGYDFTETTGVKLLAGREFSKQYPADTADKTAMINETAAKLMNLKDPIGAVIKWGDQPMTVVGVYKDFVHGSPYDKTAPAISVYAGGSNAVTIDLRLNPAHSLSANIDQVSKTLKEIDPAYPPTINFVDSEFGKKFQSEQTLAMLANIFGGLAIIISCLGLFGLAAYAAEQRTKEIGVRKVLGATVANLVALLSKDFLYLVLIAIFIGIPVSIYVMNKWLEKYDYRTTLNWWIMALAGILTIAIALLTVSYQAIKAAITNPVKSLRSE